MRGRSRAYLEVADPQLVLVGSKENIDFELIAVVADVRCIPGVVPYLVGARITVAAVQGSVHCVSSGRHGSWKIDCMLVS